MKNKTIYIDVSVLVLATFVTGIQRVTMEIATRLVSDESLQVTLIHYNAAKNCYYIVDSDKFYNYYVNGQGRKEKMISKTRLSLSKIDENGIFFDLDAAWMCRMKRSFLLPILKRQGAKIVAHIYDIISVTHPQFCLERGVYYFLDYIGAHLQYADLIITNATATVSELENLAEKLNCKLPECKVVPLGADFNDNIDIKAEDVSEELAKIAESKPFALMVGTVEPRKNHKLLLKAYNESLKAQGINIIFAGYMGWDMEEFQEELTNHPDYGSGIYHFEGLSNKVISYLYSKALCLVFCSYTEGYGLPIVEALQRGIPVVAVDIPVYREVGQDACTWIPQDDSVALAEAITNISKENKNVNVADKAGYKAISWDDSFKLMKKAL